MIATRSIFPWAETTCGDCPCISQQSQSISPCDEATSALDPATTRSILELLKDINRRLGLTILLITHEMDVVKRICDCVAVISNGELIEQDTVSEVSASKTPLAQKFIQSTLHLDIPEDYQATSASGAIY